MYALNIKAPTYIKQILTNWKGEIDSNTITVGDFKTLFPSVEDHPDRKLKKMKQN
jgi:hypothetical protein